MSSSYTYINQIFEKLISETNNLINFDKYDVQLNELNELSENIKTSI
jgi:hypothetical protein